MDHFTKLEREVVAGIEHAAALIVRLAEADAALRSAAIATNDALFALVDRIAGVLPDVEDDESTAGAVA